jgi:DNA-binding NarL/FixJ family response regulator
MIEGSRSTTFREGIAAPFPAQTSAQRSGIETLSFQDSEMLFLILEGCSTALIAQHLGTTKGTAKIKLKNLLRKLGVENRTQVVIWALAKFRESGTRPAPSDGGFDARHILVVDDDGDVRDVIVEILNDNGFTTTSANGGGAMREVLAANAFPIDAIVLDAWMPGEASAALAHLAEFHRLPVVMISGSHEFMTFAADHGLQLLRKPFRAAELIQAVESAMASGQSGQRRA